MSVIMTKSGYDSGCYKCGKGVFVVSLGGKWARLAVCEACWNEIKIVVDGLFLAKVKRKEEVL